MRKRLKIVVLVDEAEIPANDPEFKGFPPEPTTEYHVIGKYQLSVPQKRLVSS